MDRGRRLAGFAAALVLLAAWCRGYLHLDETGPPAAAPAVAAAGAGSAAAADEGRPAAVYAPHLPLSAARPLRVDIPSVGVHAPVVVRGLTRAGAVDPPPYTTPGVAGWYGAGPAPGAEGAALIVGHVDTATRPAVFYPLSTVAPGRSSR